MNRQYYSLFRKRRLHHQHAKQRILSLFPSEQHQQLLNLDQMLFLLDQYVQGKANRAITTQLFRQAQNKTSQTTLSDLVSKYLENLQTSKLCILRDQAKLKQLEDKAKGFTQREKAFIFFKLISVTVYTQFAKQNSLQYRILPTDIPPVSLNYGQYSLLNHQFVLEMQEPEFDLVFYENGLEIMKWTFPDLPNLPEGQYSRNIESQHLSFQAKIKYLPKGRQKQLTPLWQQINEHEVRLERQFIAFEGLCNYEPFLQKKEKLPHAQEVQWGKRQCWRECCPWIKSQVLGVYYFTIFLMILEAGTASEWSSQFLDLIALFSVLSTLSDPKRMQYFMIVSIIQWTFVLLILKSIWALVSPPLGTSTTISQALLIISVIGQAILIILLFLLKGADSEIRLQCDKYILRLPQKQKQEKVAPIVPALQHDIWDD